MDNNVEQEIAKMLSELQDLEKMVQSLNTNGMRINEELSATVEILKNQINTMNAK
jgi:hypothetical protein